MTQADLLPGDVLLYKPSGFFGRVIALKTWHQIAHCESYIGAGESVASRDGKGVGKYQVRLDGLCCVMRPKVAGDLAAGLRWFETVEGMPYGWLDLGAFIGLGYDGPGMICSTFLTSFERAKGLEIFNSEPARSIAPFQFELEPAYRCHWKAS